MGEHPGTWFNLIEQLIPESLRAVINPAVLASWAVIILLVVAIVVGTRNMKSVPRGLQNLWEWTYDVFRNFALSAMGPEGEKYIPFLACCFIYIFCLNVFGIIPGFISPTATINMTAALMLVVIVYVQYEGIRVNGFKYLQHFIGEPFEPKFAYYLMVPLNLIIHVIGEFVAKPLSLTIRLFGNIFGEDTVVAELTKLAVRIQHAIFIPVPIQLVMVLFGIFGGFIQAYIFTMLAAVYISLAISGGHEEHHDEAGGHDEPVQASNA